MENYSRIALFFWYPKSVTSMGIALGTLCRITHCAVEIDGVWKDASESRGNYDRVNMTKLATRKCLIIDRVVPAEKPKVPIDDLLQGMSYDWSGVMTWLPVRWWCALTKQSIENNEPYCFEVGYLALMGGWNSSPVSGCDIRNMAEKRGLTIRYGRFGAIA